MGQKIDTKNIFQIGKNKKEYIWDLKNFEEKNESNIFILKNLEIKKFIKKYLKDNGLTLYKYKIHFLESTIKIFISYLKLPKSQTIINSINTQQKLRLIKINVKKNNYKKKIKKYLDTKTHLKRKQNILENKIKKRIKIIQYLKYYIKIKKNNIIKNINTNNFLEKILESLKKFTNNQFNIILNLQQLNNKLTFNLTFYQLQHFKKLIIQLRQFKKSKFFKEGINIIFLSLIKKKSSQLLANFIANQLKLVKKHGFFLKFLKKAMSLMLTNKLSSIISIKMIIKGRFNGTRRSKKKIITINKNMPLMTLKSNINFTQCTAYGSNGTFGIKLWINEKYKK